MAQVGTSGTSGTGRSGEVEVQLDRPLVLVPLVLVPLVPRRSEDPLVLVPLVPRRSGDPLDPKWNYKAVET